jgi:glycosyltransferase involved in cell wall biosynthesis
MADAPLRIYFLAADFNGCGFYRCGLPAQALKALGHETYCSVALESFARDADVIIGQRVCRPEISETWQQLAADGHTLVYEVDDDLMNVDPSSPVAWEYFNRPDVRRRIRENAAVAKMVTVTTEALAEVMREYNDNVVVIPNFIDEEIFQIAEPKTPYPTIGWAGSTTHKMDFETCSRMLKKFAQRRPDVHWQFSGADYGWKLFPKDRYSFHDFTLDIFEHYRRVAPIHIGIAPLRAHRFNASKSAVKILEYAALGIPAVASATGPYPEFIRHGETGFLVKTEYDWVKYLGQLVDDPELLVTMSANAFAQAKENTIQGNAWRWEQAFRSIL